MNKKPNSKDGRTSQEAHLLREVVKLQLTLLDNKDLKLLQKEISELIANKAEEVEE